MDDDNIILRPFEKPQPPPSRFRKPSYVRPKALVHKVQPDVRWATWNKPPEAPRSKPQEQSDTKQPVEQPVSEHPTSKSPLNSPGLNLKHGFIRSIRHRISKNLTKEGQAPKEKDSRSSDNTHFSDTKLCCSNKRKEDLPETWEDVPRNNYSKLKSSASVTSPSTKTEPKHTAERTSNVDDTQRAFGPRKTLSEAVKSKSDTCLSVGTCRSKAESAKAKERPRRRPSMQLYQPPGRRRQDTDSVLQEIGSYEQRGMTSAGNASRTSSPSDPIMGHNATDSEVEGLGMPLRRTEAKTNLTARSKSTKPHTNNLAVTIGRTDRRVFLSTESSTCNVSHPEKCNGESSDVESDASKVTPTTKTANTPIMTIDTLTSTIDSLLNLKPDNQVSLATEGSVDEMASSDSTSGDICERFSFLNQMFEIDVAFDEVDVKGYPDWAQRYIFEAYYDPKLVSEEILSEIGRLIAERAWAAEEGDKYRLIAARLCQRIAKKEFDNEEHTASVQSLPFQRGILDGCYKAFQRRRLQTKEAWRTYATFCSDLLRRLEFGSVAPKVLCTLVLNVMEQYTLTLLDCPEEIETVAEMLARCGGALEKENTAQLEQLIDRLVTNLLTNTDAKVKLNVSLIQEMYAGDWYLSPARRAYYTQHR